MQRAVYLMRRHGGAFEIEYAAGYLLQRDLARLPRGSPQRVEAARRTFEQFGLHPRCALLAPARATSCASATPSSGSGTARSLVCDRPRRVTHRGAGYEYIVAPAVERLDSAALAVVADGIADAVIARLLTS